MITARSKFLLRGFINYFIWRFARQSTRAKVPHFEKNIQFMIGNVSAIHPIATSSNMWHYLAQPKKIISKYIKMINEEEITQLAKELHKRALVKFPRRSVRAFLPDELWAADLVDMSNIKNKNKKITFLLNIVDVYSRFAYSIPLKNKTGEAVLEAFESIPGGRTPRYLWVDDGKEFYNKYVIAWCKTHHILMYSTHSGLKSVFAESFNKTEKNAFYHEFNKKLTKNYYTFLPEFLETYNNTVHSATKETPDKIYNHGAATHESLLTNLNAEKPKFKVGEYVRLSKVKKTFEKGYTIKWTNEAFKIVAIDDNQSPIMYELEDLMGEKVDGKIYSQELQKTKVPFVKIIDKVVKRKLGANKMVLVSYEGWPEKFNTWITDSEYKKWVKFKNEL